MTDRRASSCATYAAPRRWAAAGGARCDLLYLISVTEFKRTLLRHRARLRVVARAAADALRRAAGVFTQVFRLGSRGAALPGPAAVQHRALRLLPGGDGDRGRLDRQSGGGGAQDAVPAPRHPARRRAHELLQPRAEPRRGLRLHPRLRGRRRCGPGCCSRSCSCCS